MASLMDASRVMVMGSETIKETIFMESLLRAFTCVLKTGSFGQVIEKGLCRIRNIQY
jgi:hypothetical protein